MWIQTYTGRKFTPLAPQAADVCIEDIAHALAMTCRFTGHVLQFYSVAEHCVHVSRLVQGPTHVPKTTAASAAIGLHGLLHDASEAYLVDLAAPIKGQVYLGVDSELVPVKVMEGRIMDAVAAGLQLEFDPEDHWMVKLMDLRMLMAEKDALMVEAPEPWAINVPPAPVKIECWSPGRAEREFLERYQELRGILAEGVAA